MFGCLAVWSLGRLFGWLFVCLVGRLFGCFLVGWLAVSLFVGVFFLFICLFGWFVG